MSLYSMAFRETVKSLYGVVIAGEIPLSDILINIDMFV